MKLWAIVAGIALVLAVAPAHANPTFKITGSQFYRLCTNPPPERGAQVEAACVLYVSGVADGLQLDGKVCPGPYIRPPQLFPVALNWLRTRLRNPRVNGNYPASVMIRNGLVNAFPCRPGTQCSRC